MTRAAVIRLAALSLIVGAILLGVLMIVSAIAFPNQDPTGYAGNPAFAIVNLLSAIGAALLLLGLPILLLDRVEEFGLLGVIGFALIFLVGLMFGVFFGLFGAVIVPIMGTKGSPSIFSGEPGPSLFAFFIGATLFELVGAVLLAIAAFRRRGGVRSWLGYLFALTAVFTVIGFVASSPGSNNVFAALLSDISGVLLMIAFVWLGYELWSAQRLAAT